MAFWSGEGDQIQLKDTNKSSRFFYDSGDRNKPLLFKGLESSVKPTLRSLYLEHCYFDGSLLLTSLNGCVNLATIKLYDVCINHEDVTVPVTSFRKVQLPKLSTLHVYDKSERNNSVFGIPFHKVKEPGKAEEQQALAQYNVEFYSQLLQSQLSLSGCKYLHFCKFSTVNVNLLINVSGYTILKYSPLSSIEKLVISPLLDASKNQFLKNEQDQIKVKYLACSDKVLSVLTTPKTLEDLNLYLSQDNITLLVDLAISKKLSCLRSLTLFFRKRLIVDLHILSSGLKNLKELVITKAIIHSTATTPFVLSECSFDQCQFSELFMSNVPALLNCESVAIDVQHVPNWNGIFKTNLMLMPRVVRIVVWCVDTSDSDKDRVTFAEMYSKRQNDDSFVWKPSTFDDVDTRRPILLNHRVFFHVDANFPINLLESVDVPKSDSLSLLNYTRAGFSNPIFVIIMAMIVFMVYSYRNN